MLYLGCTQTFGSVCLKNMNSHSELWARRFDDSKYLPDLGYGQEYKTSSYNTGFIVWESLFVNSIQVKNEWWSHVSFTNYYFCN